MHICWVIVIVTTDKTIIKFYVPPMMTAIFRSELGCGTTGEELSDESEEEVEEVETFSEEGSVESM